MTTRDVTVTEDVRICTLHISSAKCETLLKLAPSTSLQQNAKHRSNLHPPHLCIKMRNIAHTRAVSSAVRQEERFRGGLVLKAHRPLYHSTLGSRVRKISSSRLESKKKRRRRGETGRLVCTGSLMSTSGRALHACRRPPPPVQKEINVLLSNSQRTSHAQEDVLPFRLVLSIKP